MDSVQRDASYPYSSASLTYLVALKEFKFEDSRFNFRRISKDDWTNNNSHHEYNIVQYSIV